MPEDNWGNKSNPPILDKKGYQPAPTPPSGKPSGGYQPGTSENKPIKPPPKKP